MRPERVSVVIPCYNCADSVGAAIKSVLDQSYPPSEIIAVDDGSTDGTGDEIARFGDRVRYLRQPNKGVSAARNRGIEAAGAKIIALQDADTFSEPHRIERQMALLQHSPDTGLVACGAWMVDEDLSRMGLRSTGTVMDEFERQGRALGQEVGGGILFTEKLFPLLLLGVFFNPATSVFRKDVFIRAGGYDPTLRSGEDYDLVLRVAACSRIGFVPEPLYSIQRGRPGLHSDRYLASGCIAQALEKVKQTDQARDPAVRKLINTRIAGKYTMMAAFRARKNDIAMARKHLLQSMRRRLRPVPLAFYMASFLGPVGRPVVNALVNRIAHDE